MFHVGQVGDFKKLIVLISERVKNLKFTDDGATGGMMIIEFKCHSDRITSIAWYNLQAVETLRFAPTNF